ncbi:MAG: redoxin family protein [Candidatus Eisenbacteria bacterium]
MRSTTLALATLLLALFLAGPAGGANDAERVAFYQACGDPDPGGRLLKMAAFLENHPRSERSDRVRTILFGVVASGAWKEGKTPVDLSRAGAIVSREAGAYLDAKEEPDRLLLVSEAYLRAGIQTEMAKELARRGGALAEAMERPGEMPIASFGRMKKERIARSDYLVGLALAAEGDRDAAADRFRKAEPVFRTDPRFREEYGRTLGAIGAGEPEDWAADERGAVAEAVAEPDREARIRKHEEYLRRFPTGSRAVEIGIRLAEEYTAIQGRKGEAVAVAERVASGTDDPEVLSALALLLADAGVGADRAAAHGERAVGILEGIVRNPATDASDLPGLHANLLLVRDAYGWALLKAGRNREAVEQLDEAAESEYPEVEYHYGVALIESGRSFDACAPLVNAAVAGEDRAWPHIERIRQESSALRSHVDDLLERAEENLRRRKLAGDLIRPAPDFSLVSTDGGVVTLSEMKGKVVVLVFWATWCEPCVEELERVGSVSERYGGKDVRFLGVNTDRDIWLVRPFLEERKIGIQTVFTAGEEDWEEKARGLEIGALPALLLVDRRGNVRYEEADFEPGGKIFEKILSWRIDRLLSER